MDITDMPDGMTHGITDIQDGMTRGTTDMPGGMTHGTATCTRIIADGMAAGTHIGDIITIITSMWYRQINTDILLGHILVQTKYLQAGCRHVEESAHQAG